MRYWQWCCVGVERKRGSILIVIFVIAAAWIGWLCAYYNTKNADNLPSLENLQMEQMEKSKRLNL